MITVNGADEIKALAGRDLGASDWLEVTQERIDTFADATGDHQWIHVDASRAAEGPFGATIAHGYLTLSLVIPLFADLLRISGTRMGVNVGLEKVRFPSPVRSGARVRATGEVVSADEVGGGVQVVVRVSVHVDGSEKPACVADTVSRFFP